MKDLITEARELCAPEPITLSEREILGVRAYEIIPQLCDALEKAEAELERWEKLYESMERSWKRAEDEVGRLNALIDLSDKSEAGLKVLYNEDIDALRQDNEQLREAQRWIDGPPSGFGGERAWVIAQIPSLFLAGAFGYKVYLWNGDGGWSDREVLRATRWCRMPLPVAPEGMEGDCL